MGRLAWIAALWLAGCTCASSRVADVPASDAAVHDADRPAPPPVCAEAVAASPWRALGVNVEGPALVAVGADGAVREVHRAPAPGRFGAPVWDHETFAATVLYDDPVECVSDCVRAEVLTWTAEGIRTAPLRPLLAAAGAGNDPEVVGVWRGRLGIEVQTADWPRLARMTLPVDQDAWRLYPAGLVRRGDPVPDDDDTLAMVELAWEQPALARPEGRVPAGGRPEHRKTWTGAWIALDTDRRWLSGKLRMWRWSRAADVELGIDHPAETTVLGQDDGRWIELRSTAGRVSGLVDLDALRFLAAPSVPEGTSTWGGFGGHWYVLVGREGPLARLDLRTGTWELLDPAASMPADTRAWNCDAPFVLEDGRVGMPLLRSGGASGWYVQDERGVFELVGRPVHDVDAVRARRVASTWQIEARRSSEPAGTCPATGRPAGAAPADAVVGPATQVVRDGGPVHVDRETVHPRELDTTGTCLFGHRLDGARLAIRLLDVVHGTEAIVPLDGGADARFVPLAAQRWR